MPWRILYAEPGWTALAPQLNEILGDSGFQQIKSTARSVAGFAEWADRSIFVKRSRTRGYWPGVSIRMFGSRAARALRGARMLAAAGFNYPALLMIAEERQWGSIYASYIVTELLAGAKLFGQVAVGRRRDKLMRKLASDAVAAEVRRLHDSGIYTRDMQETNIMVVPRKEGFKVYFVDFEDFRKVKEVSLRRRLTNMVHLDRSIGRFASKAHRLRFLYSYFGRPATRESARELLRRYAAIRRRVEHRKTMNPQSGRLPLP